MGHYRSYLNLDLLVVQEFGVDRGHDGSYLSLNLSVVKETDVDKSLRVLTEP